MDGENTAAESKQVVLAPDPHTHGHDVGALQKWMDDVDERTESAFEKARKQFSKATVTPAEASEQFHRLAEQLVEELYAKGKKYTVYHNELARQTAVHCPRVARYGRAACSKILVRLSSRWPRFRCV